MKSKSLIKHTVILALPKVLTFIIGVLRAKLNALYLGTEGLGLVSQINFASFKIRNFTLMGMNDGLVKQLSSNKNNDDFKREFGESIKTYILLTSITTISSILLLLVFRKNLTIYLFGNNEYIKYYYISILLIPILILYSYYFAILKSFTASHLISHVEYATTILSFLLFIPAVIFYHLNGVVVIIVLKYLFQLIMTCYYANKYYLKPFKLTLNFIINSNFSTFKFKELMIFANVSLFVGIIQIVTDFYSRSIIIRDLGIDKLGLYAPNIAWGGIFVSFIVPAMYTYLYPVFGSLKSNKEIVTILNNAIRLIIFAIVPFLFFGISLRHFIIVFFYSNEFIESANYLPFHFLGVFFISLMETVSQVFTPTGRIMINARIMIFRYILQVIIAYFFIPIFGLYAYSFMFIFPALISLIIMHFVLRKQIKFKIEKNNIIIAIYVLLISLILYFISNYNQFYSIVFSVLFFTLTWTFLKKEEKTYILEMINKVNFYKNK